MSVLSAAALQRHVVANSTAYSYSAQPPTVSACKATAYSYGKMAFMVQSLFAHTVEDR